MGLDLDFVNLRSEEYAEHSRIPETMRFGTPKEDAERRDLTINSLFYNLHTESVEDFTGKGVDDIENGIIRTPLDPMTTFLDDPLRVLRAVRFAARLDFKITPEVKAAMMNKSVKVSLPRYGD
jgi:tRNA nucleotidyltransferase (CCA-adding enzyme)